MKKITKKNTIITLTTVVLCALLYINSCTDFNLKNLQYQSPLPIQYKNYRTLNSLVSDSVFEITSRLPAPAYYDSLNNNIICVNNYPESDSSVYYRMNADGIITDSLHLNDEVDYESHYLLNLDYYYDWVLTGDKKKQQYITIENSNITTPEILDSVVKKIFQQASATHIYYGDYTFKDGKIEKSENAFLFLLGKKWYKLSVDKDLDKYTSQRHYYKYNNNRIRNFCIVDDTLALPYGLTAANFKDDKSIPTVPFYVAYFHREEHETEVSGTMNNDHGAFWDGVAYINYVYGTDTLKFKNQYVLQMDKTHWASWVKYDYCPEVYVNPRLNFIVIGGYMVKHKRK